jgi:hypothetical protein
MPRAADVCTVAMLISSVINMNVQSDLRICARAECATRTLREACFKLTETYSDNNGTRGISLQK